MKKLLILIMTFVMTFVFGYVTLASTIDVGVTEGFELELANQVDPSSDDILVTGSYGVSEQLLFSVGYYTDCKDMDLGVRYAFAENMAVTLDYLMPDADGADDTPTFGFRYKSELSQELALVGVLEYADYDDDPALGLKAQAEYAFNDKVVGNLGFVYTNWDKSDDTTDIIAGIEVYPVEKLKAYLDYTVVDTDGEDDTIELGVSYKF